MVCFLIFTLLNVNYIFFSWNTSPSPKLAWFMSLFSKRSSWFFLITFFSLFYDLFYNLQSMWSRRCRLVRSKDTEGKVLQAPWGREEPLGVESRGDRRVEICSGQKRAPASEQSIDRLLLFKKQNLLGKWRHLNQSKWI